MCSMRCARTVADVDCVLHDNRLFCLNDNQQICEVCENGFVPNELGNSCVEIEGLTDKIHNCY